MDVPPQQMPDRPPADARRAKRQRNVSGWVRLVLVAIVSTVCFSILLVLAWLNFAGGRLGWIPSLLAFSGFGVGTGWLAVSKRWQTARRRSALGLAALAGIVGISITARASG